MFYVGLDIHVKYTTVCVLDNDGKVFKRCTTRNNEQLIETLTKLRGQFSVCFEASTGYGRYFELLSKHAARVVVAHAGHLRLIFRSKQKNDRNDAEKLAYLLFIDQVPPVHVPSADVRAWREMITFRRKTVEKRTRAKNGIRGQLRSLGIHAPSKPGLWTQCGMTWLKQLDLDNLLQSVKRNMLIAEIEHLSELIAEIEKALDRQAANSAAVTVLRSIPGIGPRTSEAVTAFMDDPRRFANSKRVGAYFGLVPSQDQSGSKNRLGHITREGSPTVRHLLTEAVWQATRRSPTVKAFFERIHRGEKDRRKIAIVATAHYLIRVMWSMLKSGELWRESVEA
jgi:transposase